MVLERYTIIYRDGEVLRKSLNLGKSQEALTSRLTNARSSSSRSALTQTRLGRQQCMQNGRCVVHGMPLLVYLSEQSYDDIEMLGTIEAHATLGVLRNCTKEREPQITIRRWSSDNNLHAERMDSAWLT